MRTGDSLLCKGIWCLDKPLLFKGFWLSVASPPATEVWFTRTGDSLLCKGTWRLDKPLLFNDFWLSVQSPPATEVWFREPGTPCFAKVFGASINLCFSMASGFLCSHPRPQRCGSAALHHTSLRSLKATASLIGSC